MPNKLTLALINAGIAALLVFAGAFTDGQITSTGVIAALSAALIIFLTRLQDFFKTTKKKKGVKASLFEFI